MRTAAGKPQQMATRVGNFQLWHSLDALWAPGLEVAPGWGVSGKNTISVRPVDGSGKAYYHYSYIHIRMVGKEMPLASLLYSTTTITEYLENVSRKICQSLSSIL